jgi:hypothetical protein
MGGGNAGTRGHGKDRGGGVTLPFPRNGDGSGGGGNDGDGGGNGGAAPELVVAYSNLDRHVGLRPGERGRKEGMMDMKDGRKEGSEVNEGRERSRK